MNQFKLDASLCTKCGLCVGDCATCIIEIDENGFPSVSSEKEAQCLRCQHCMASCPTGAISILGKNPSNSRVVSSIARPTFEQMDHFVRSRRSIRHYKDENVDPVLIDKLLKSLAHVPTGCNAEELTFNIIDDKAEMKKFSERVVTALIDAANNRTSDHPFLAQIGQLPREAVDTMVFRTAPHALIVSGPQDAPCVREDIALSLAYFELLAQSAGLGTVWWGFLRLTTAIVPEVKPLLGIPDNHEFYAMLFGPPAIQFARTAQKEDAAQTRRITF